MPPNWRDELAMQWVRSLLLLPIAILLLSPGSAAASTVDGRPKILLHVRPTTAESPCGNGMLAQCQDAVTGGITNVAYHLFVLAARGNQADLAGVQFGIDYEGTFDPVGSGAYLDVFSWTLCATLEFPSPNPPWPSPGGGTLITWDSVTTCQTGDVAVVGYFYMTAYNAATMRVLPRPIDGAAKVATCGSAEVLLDYGVDLGCAYFSPQGALGCNPCLHPCFIDAVEASTWSRIKAQATDFR